MSKNSVYEDTNPRKLKELLQQIAQKDSALPDFQRDFVWKPAQTAELIISIANNFPAGSLLRIRNTQKLFALREFEGAPSLGNQDPQFLVLDGQQRLTSLYRAFYGAGETRYFLDLNKLIAGEDIEEAVFWEKFNSKREIELRDTNSQKNELIFPLATLWGGSGYLSWMMIVAAPPSDPSVATRQSDLMTIYHDWIETIEGYEFPVVTLSSSNSAEAVCTIFETLNRTGVKLTAFDLLTARFYPQGVMLRNLWDKAISDYPIFVDYDIDAFYLLQVVAFLEKSAPSCKKSDVLSLSAAEITNSWPKAVDGMNETLEMLRQDCGVLSSKWIPYAPLLVPCAATFAKTSSLTGPSVGVRRTKLKRWFWCASFGQAYEKAANSQSARDFNALIKWLAGGSEPDSVTNFSWQKGGLRNVTPRQSGLYKAAMSLVISGHSLDFHSGARIDAAVLKANDVDDHHIFPTAFLKNNSRIANATTASKDGILNRTLIDSTTNKTISGKGPSKYISEISNFAGSSLDAVLASHSLPPAGDVIWASDNFSGLVDWREAKLEALILQVTQ